MALRTAYLICIASFIAAVFLLFAVESGGRPASAADFTVDSTADAADASPGDGVCDDGAGNCTLRAAIQETNALPSPDAITLPAGTYTLAIPGTKEDAAATGDLDITDDLTITGAGEADTIIDGGALDRVIHIVGAVPADIAALTIRNGDSQPRAGGGIDGNGGGIYNPSGTLTLTNVVLTDNKSIDYNYHDFGGGGLANGGTATLTLVTVTNNDASLGGGILNEETGTLVLVDSTVADNLGRAWGGGIRSGGTATIMRTTISNNETSEGGGGIIGGDLTLTNSTVNGNSVVDLGGIGGIGSVTADIANSTIIGNRNWLLSIGSNLSGNGTIRNSVVEGCPSEFTSLGHNLYVARSPCSSATPSDSVVSDPLLRPLHDNGGPTLTHALLPGSPAIDAGDNDACPATDQRGVARPVDGDDDGTAVCDIGAYEAPEHTVVLPTPTPTPAPVSGPAGLPAVGGEPGSDGDAPTVAMLLLMAGALGLAGVGSALMGRWQRR